MPDSGGIRVATDDQEVFQQVLNSLESHREPKAEKDILEEIREHFKLPQDFEQWPAKLREKGVSTESFLDFVLGLMAPFVEMVMWLYGFFSKYVSTTGGRTTHFQITQKGNGAVLNFPNVDFPRKVQWIQTWAEVQTQPVTIDWERIARLLLIDNGIFYGTVREVRLIQSLIAARREGRLSPKLRDAGDRISEVLRSAVRAWFMTQRAKKLAEIPDAQPRWVRRVFVPALYSDMVKRGKLTSSDRNHSYIGADLEVALAGSSRQYRTEEVFIDLDEKKVIELKLEAQNDRPDWMVEGAVFFIALWGLEEESFRYASGLLAPYERPDALLWGADLDLQDRQLAEEELDLLKAAIVPERPGEKSIEQVRKKLEILLLPYWKDRWFLYEVWTLCLPLSEALNLHGQVEFLGVRPIAEPDIIGTTWDLPTQKAKEPVARVSGATPESNLLVWFQRETLHPTGEGHIEPDVRITLAADPCLDLLILECKDRVKFSRRDAEKVGQDYLDGSAAKVVWIVNYEASTQKWPNALHLQEQDGRQLGIAYYFRPGSIHPAIKDSIDGIFKEELGLPVETAQEKVCYLIIDKSGSMKEKVLPDRDLLLSPDFVGVYTWCEQVEEVPPDDMEVIALRRSMRTAGAEAGAALADFAASLPENACLTLLTDITGEESLKPYLVPMKEPIQDSRYQQMISGKAIELILL